MESTFKNYALYNNGIEFAVFFDVYSRINHNLWSAYRKKEIAKKDLIRQRFQLTFDELQINGIDPEKINAHYLNEMAHQEYLVEGAIDILQYLKSKRYRLFIITNGFKEVQHRKLENTGLKSFFNKVFISEEVKTPKPGREIFEYAIKSTNAKKSESLMIGDDWDVDVIGALNFGIDAVYFTKADKDFFKKNENNNISGLNIYKMLELSALKNLL